MDAMSSALWDLFEKQKLKGLIPDMRQTLLKLGQAGRKDGRWYNAMGEVAALSKGYWLASRCYQLALDLEEKPAYRLNLANSLYFLGEFDRAKEILAGYLERHGMDYHALLNMANCCLRSGQLREAAEICRRGAAMPSGRFLFLNALGQVSWEEGDPERALAHFERAYAEAPDYLDALFNMANAKARLGRTEEALHDYRLCLRKDETYLHAYYNLAATLITLGRHPEARVILGQARRLDADGVIHHYLLGLSRMGEKEYRLSRDAFRAALAKEPGHLPSLLALARLSLLESDPDQARQLAASALDRDRIPKEERLAALEILFQAGDYRECRNRLEALDASALYPDAAPLFAAALWKCGEPAAARGILENLLARFPGHAAGLRLLARLLAETGNLEGAADKMRLAWRKAPDLAATAVELAALLRDQGREGEALEVLEQAHSRHPSHPDILYNLACSLALRGDVRAGEHLRQALAGGFNDLEWMQRDPDLESLRGAGAYRDIFNLATAA